MTRCAVAGVISALTTLGSGGGVPSGGVPSAGDASGSLAWWAIGLVGLILGFASWWLGDHYLTRYALEAPENDEVADPTAPPRPPLPRNNASAMLVSGLVLGALGVYGARQSGIVGHPGLTQAIMLLAVSALVLVVMRVDWTSRRIPNQVSLGLFGCALLQSLLLGRPAVTDLGLGLLVGGGLLVAVALIRPGAMGLGDVKLAGALGALLGYPLILPGLLLGMFVAGLVAAALLVVGRATRKSYIAYGPYLAGGAWLVWMLQSGILLAAG